MSGHWEQATTDGLADDDLRATAAQLHELAESRLPGLGLRPETLDLGARLLRRRLADGISPALERTLEGSR